MRIRDDQATVLPQLEEREARADRRYQEKPGTYLSWPAHRCCERRKRPGYAGGW